MKITEIGDKDRADVILTNPPFGGEDEAGIRSSFPADKQTPLPEQRRLVAYLDDLQAKVDQPRNAAGPTAAELDALLPSILDRAFRGEL